MAGTRHFTAGVILYTIMRMRGAPSPTRANWKSAAIVGLLLLAGANGLVSWAEITVPSAVTALLVGSVPLWMILIDWISGRYRDKSKRPSWLAFAGVISGFIGIALLVGPNEIAGQRVDPLGAAALLIGAVLWAGGSLYSRTADLPASPLLGTGMEMMIGGLGCFIISGLTGEWGRLDLAAVSTSSVTGLIYLIVFGSLVGFASYTWLLRAAPTTLVSTYAYVNPVVAIFLGVLLADEVISPRMILAAVIILASVALITFTRQPVKVKAPAGAVSD
ncbi:MAG TPA: EamA family transporter, partial [Bellilinea sp.]